jgi:hypothetical protein
MITWNSLISETSYIDNIKPGWHRPEPITWSLPAVR